ncbi:hypothetical protein WA026_012653 [Henosepilachna vigintioctopunctata]|uniref:Envelope protein n=1 Tax=Henosepilachna vigintioctopunctata TaxID=420089 RepID=A0AAW1UAM3_9CUCU
MKYTKISTHYKKISKKSFKHQTIRLGSWLKWFPTLTRQSKKFRLEKLRNFTQKLNQGLEAVQEMQKLYKAANANTLNMNIIHASSKVHRTSNYETAVKTENSPETSIENICPKIKRRHLGQHFIISELNSYELFKVTSIPVKMTSTSYWIIEEPSNLIEVDYNNEMFFEVPEKNFQENIQIKNHTYLCSPTVVKNIETNPNCIIDQIFNRVDRAHCTIKEILWRSTRWKQLYLTNTWLYSTFQPKRISVICNGQRKEVIIKDSGVIKLSENCVLKTNNFFLIFLTPKITSSVTVTSTAVKPITVNITTHLESLDTTPVIQVDDVLEAIDHPLPLVNQESDFHPKIWKKVHGHATAISTSTYVLCVIAAMFIYCLYKMLKTRIQTPSMTNIESDNMSPVSSAEGHRPMEPDCNTIHNCNTLSQRGECSTTFEMKPLLLDPRSLAACSES